MLPSLVHESGQVKALAHYSYALIAAPGLTAQGSSIMSQPPLAQDIIDNAGFVTVTCQAAGWSAAECRMRAEMTASDEFGKALSIEVPACRMSQESGLSRNLLS